MLGNPLIGFEVQRSAIVNFSRAGRPMLHGHETHRPPNPL